MGIEVIVALAGAAATAYAANRSRAAGQDAARNAERTQGNADPFAAMRPEFQEMFRSRFAELSSLDPNAVKDSPAYKFQLQEGLQAVDNQASSQGLLRSGSRPLERMRYAEGLASSFAQNDINNRMGLLGMLGNFAGAGVSNPVGAAQVGLNQSIFGQSQINSANNAMISSLPQWTRAISSIFGGGNSNAAANANGNNNWFTNNGP